ncbi:MAG TPA: C25 family cysteine peptidase, partial [Candidatus Eisenbacteria bacterium]|nr:C25 family cysteine peptidase [Candidatus Eisenbacteria bacterium]
GEGDASFDASDRMVFYGLGPDNYRDRFGLPPGTEEYFLNPYSDHTVYWLTWGGTFPDPPHRMATVDATPSSPSPATVNAAARVHAEQNTIYAPSLIEGGLRWEMWFWDILSSQSSFYRALVTLPGLVPGSQMSGNIRLWGASEPEGNGNEDLHNVQVDVNSVSQGTYQWGGPTLYDDYSPKDIAFSSVNAASPARIEFRVPSIVTGRLDIQYLAWIDVHYRRILALGSQPGELEVDSGDAERVIHIAQVPTGTLDVFDVTSFRHPRRLSGWVSVPTVSGPGIDVGLESPENAVIAVASRSLPRTPQSKALDDAPGTWLRDVSQGLDHVIIAHDDFMNEAEELAAHRRTVLPFVSAPRARAVRVSDVMDEFAWGMWDPLALRYFLEYVYRYYGSATAPLTYAVFLGDHTYDFRNYLGTGTRDLVPSWEDNHDNLGFIQDGSTQYVSDDPLAMFDGLDDVFVDVATGRIPVSSVSAARAVIENKILHSETNPEFGSWRARAVIATDDLCQFGDVDPVGQDVLDTAEEVDQLLPAAFDRAKVYMTEYGTACTIASKPEASDDFIDLWNSGAWLVNYLGHGTETFLSDERLLSLGDVPTLTNLDRLPLFIATASKSAKWNLPNQTSITESVAISPVGGALAATGSTSDHTFASTAFQLNKNFVSRLFRDPSEEEPPPRTRFPAGLAFAQSKGFAGQDTKKYVYFGDPASFPPAALPRNLRMALAGPDTLVRGALASVGTQLLTADPAAAFDEWLLEIRAEDARIQSPLGYRLPGDLMFRGDARFSTDSLATAFVVPISAREGPDARIRGYAWTDGGDAVAAITPLPIAGSVDPSLDTQGPVITFEAHPPEMTAGQTIGVVFEDPSGILLFTSGEPALVLVVLDAQNAEVLRMPLTEDFAYDVGQHTRGTVRFAIPEGLENGTYTFRVSAADNFGNPTAATTTVQISSGGNGVSFTSVYAYPNPLTTDTDVVFTLDRDVQVTLRIYSVSGRLVQHTTLSGAPGQNGYHWNGRDQAGDPVANGVYLLQLSAPGSDESVKHMERLVVLR